MQAGRVDDPLHRPGQVGPKHRIVGGNLGTDFVLERVELVDRRDEVAPFEGSRGRLRWGGWLDSLSSSPMSSRTMPRRVTTTVRASEPVSCPSSTSNRMVWVPTSSQLLTSTPEAIGTVAPSANQ